ncbi:hypothetical protein AKO1_007983 [Acrasis kona]|uniref:Xaa-Pro dipeptidyl-peptidase-like domain-containing protein n=1 Tax=Acrasis kona TaxID=1008807 RepID=A0AAW2YQG5_9EUKA
MALNTTQYRTLRSTLQAGHILPNATDRVFPEKFQYFENIKYHHNPKYDLDLDYESLDIPTKEGATLNAWYVPVQNKTCDGNHNIIILVHGAFVDRREMLKHCLFLNQIGYHTILFDARDHGISGALNRGCSLGVREHEDVLSVVEYLIHHKRGEIGRIGVLGSSNGGSSSIMAAALSEKIEVVIAENPFSSRIQQLRYSFHSAIRKGVWGREKLSELSTFGKVIGSISSSVPDWFLDLAAELTNYRMGGYNIFHAIDVVERINPRPVLIMHGDKDVHVLVDNSQELYKRANNKNAELWIVEGGVHALLFNHFELEYKKRVKNFLERNFGVCE